MSKDLRSLNESISKVLKESMAPNDSDKFVGNEAAFQRGATDGKSGNKVNNTANLQHLSNQRSKANQFPLNNNKRTKGRVGNVKEEFEQIDEMGIGTDKFQGRPSAFFKTARIAPGQTGKSNIVAGQRKSQKQQTSMTVKGHVKEDSTVPNEGNAPTVADLSARGAATEDGKKMKKNKSINDAIREVVNNKKIMSEQSAITAPSGALSASELAALGGRIGAAAPYVAGPAALGAGGVALSKFATDAAAGEAGRQTYQAMQNDPYGGAMMGAMAPDWALGSAIMHSKKNEDETAPKNTSTSSSGKSSTGTPPENEPPKDPNNPSFKDVASTAWKWAKNNPKYSIPAAIGSATLGGAKWGGLDAFSHEYRKEGNPSAAFGAVPMGAVKGGVSVIDTLAGLGIGAVKNLGNVTGYRTPSEPNDDRGINNRNPIREDKMVDKKNESGTKDRESIQNVARPDSDYPFSKKSKLAKQAEIKKKLIDETRRLATIKGVIADKKAEKSGETKVDFDPELKKPPINEIAPAIYAAGSAAAPYVLPALGAGAAYFGAKGLADWLANRQRGSAEEPVTGPTPVELPKRNPTDWSTSFSQRELDAANRGEFPSAPKSEFGTGGAAGASDDSGKKLPSSITGALTGGTTPPPPPPPDDDDRGGGNGGGRQPPKGPNEPPKGPGEPPEPGKDFNSYLQRAKEAGSTSARKVGKVAGGVTAGGALWGGLDAFGNELVKRGDVGASAGAVPMGVVKGAIYPWELAGKYIVGGAKAIGGGGSSPNAPTRENAQRRQQQQESVNQKNRSINETIREVVYKNRILNERGSGRGGHGTVERPGERPSERGEPVDPNTFDIRRDAPALSTIWDLITGQNQHRPTGKKTPEGQDIYVEPETGKEYTLKNGDVKQYVDIPEPAKVAPPATTPVRPQVAPPRPEVAPPPARPEVVPPARPGTPPDPRTRPQRPDQDTRTAPDTGVTVDTGDRTAPRDQPQDQPQDQPDPARERPADPRTGNEDPNRVRPEEPRRLPVIPVMRGRLSFRPGEQPGTPIEWSTSNQPPEPPGGRRDVNPYGVGSGPTNKYR